METGWGPEAWLLRVSLKSTMSSGAYRAQDRRASRDSPWPEPKKKDSASGSHVCQNSGLTRSRGWQLLSREGRPTLQASREVERGVSCRPGLATSPTLRPALELRGRCQAAPPGMTWLQRTRCSHSGSRMAQRTTEVWESRQAWDFQVSRS